MTTKYDVKRELKKCYAPTNTDWALVDVPELRFLAIDGHGDPNTSAGYRHSVEALYSVAYTVKFASRNDLGRDFVVGPLEGLWWADDMDDFLARQRRARQVRAARTAVRHGLTRTLSASRSAIAR